ncbi:MAG: hypothetical protein K2M92_01115, partial [Bacteroidales bacterium]|nr:hypothetical protein [Bacteroidales bacterium]
RIKRTPAEKEAIYALPLHMQYEVVCVNVATRHRVLQHILVDPTARDYKQVRAVAVAYTEECDCWINPVVVANERVGRAKIYPDIKDSASPDLFTEKYGYLDVKSPLNKSNIIRNANLACSQGAIAVLTDFYLPDTLSIYKAKSITFDIFFGRNIDKDGKPNYTKDEVHWFINGTLYKLNRPGKNESFSA